MCKQKTRASLRCFVRAFNGTTVDNHHLIDPGLGLAPFEAFIGRYTTGTHVEVEEADTADVVVVATVASQTGTTTIAHPERGLVALVLIEHTVIIDMVARYELVIA